MDNKTTDAAHVAQKKPHGRPQKNLDVDEFEKLCSMQCTQAEIAGFFNVDEDTVTAWCKREYGMTFEEVFAQKKLGGRASLRRKQWQMADKNPAMAIFLGKQYLGQSDDPAKAEREKAAGDKLGDFIDALTDAVTAGGD